MAAISYDSVEVLRTFAKRAGITIPLLSDPKSEIIKAFGILNTTVPRNTEFYGVPFPGTYIVDERGRVKSKYFEKDYRERFNPATILNSTFGMAASQTLVRTDHLSYRTYVTQTTAKVGHRISLVIEVELPPRMHVYAPGVEGYRPVNISLDANPGIRVHDLVAPKSRVLHLPAIDERVPVYEKKVRLSRDVTIAANYREPTLEISGTFDYQACDDKVCFTPAKAPIRFTVQMQQLDRTRAPEELRKKPQ